MPDFIVHTIPGSPYARAVLATLEEKGASYKIAPIKPGEHKSDAYRSLHAFSRMPVLDHNGFILYETQAILRYLDRVLATPGLTPADAKRAARMDQVMNINDWYLFHNVANVIVAQRVILPMLFGATPDEAVIAAAMPKAHVAFDELTRLLGDSRFFTGDSLSLADLAIAPQLDMFVGIPEWETLTRRNPALRAWLERMNARVSMQATTWQRVAAMAASA